MRIYAIGDSHMQMLGPLLRSELSEDYVMFYASPGASTKRVLEELDTVKVLAADVIVIELGGNDFGDQSVARKDLVWQIRKLNTWAPILWFGPSTALQWPASKRHNDQALDQSGQLPKLGVRWYDSRRWTDTEYASDGVHFSLAGYDRWASEIVESIRSMRRSRFTVLAVSAVAMLGLCGYLARRFF